MTAPLSDGLADLRRRFGVRVEIGSVIYGQGAAPGRFYVVERGRVVFETISAEGAVRAVGTAGAGECFGHADAFAGRPTSTSATAIEPTVLIAIPLAQAAEAFALAPQLAVQLIAGLAGAQQQAQAEASTAMPARAPSAHAAREQPPAPASREPVSTKAGEGTPDHALGVEARFNGERFFTDTAVCPVCEAQFEYLRLCSGAVTPVSRESDLRIVHRDLDPTHYVVVVCPECSFAAYRDDFEQLNSAERERLVDRRAEREQWGRPNLCGERGLDEAALAFDLAVHCYDVRRADDRRLAGLLHRRAWVERARGDAEAERRHLDEACQSYRRAFERDDSVTDAAAQKAAYLIGDLYLRLGDHAEASRWLRSCVEMAESGGQTAIVRLARDRQMEARRALRDQDAA